MLRFFVGAGIVFALAAASVASADVAADARQELGASAQVSIHDQTGKVRFIGTPAGRPISRPAGLPANASPEAVARAFLRAHGRLFGLRDQSRELRLLGVATASRGRSAARFRQVHLGVPVLAGELVVNMDAAGNILSAGGELRPDLGIGVTAGTTAAAAARAARELVAGAQSLSISSLRASSPHLWVYDVTLLGGPGPKGPKLVWRTDVTSASRPDVRELVLVDAGTGRPVLHFSQIAHAKNRQICDAVNANAKVPCTAPFARSEGGPASSVPDVNSAYSYSGQVYDFFKNRFNRDSIDNAGMPLLQTVRFCESGCPFQNAFWNGSQMVYGPSYASADDVVGHEMTHGITERSSGLFYWFQSGAINESMSDVFGELFDQTNGAGSDGATVRWQMGEDLPDDPSSCFADGAIRSMSDPTVCGDPDRMGSGLYDDGLDLFNNVVDSGAVHGNSGVNNKAAYLMTDGGAFNGRTVTRLGVKKVARLYYEVNTNMLTPGSDYLDLHDALFQGCKNLIGTDGITKANCTEVRDATLAVEMNLEPRNNPNAFPAAPDAPMCAPGEIPTDLFYDNMENPGSGNWSPQTTLGTNMWTYIPDYVASGRLALYTKDQTARTDTAVAQATAVTVPVGKTTYARFSQITDWEYVYDFLNDIFTAADGGVVEYSTNGGASWSDAGALFTANGNGYYGTIYNTGDNPLGGRQAFTDVTGAFFASRMLLTSLAGQSVKLRFRAATDTGNVDGFFFGWLIDDVRFYTCAAGSRPGASATNLLRNPGFEWDDNDDGYADFWSANRSALRSPGAKHAGKYALRHKTADNETYSVGQKVAGIAAGSSYTASGWVNIPTTSSAVDFKVQVEFRGAGDVLIQTKTVKAYTVHTVGAWNKATAAFVAPAGTTSARVKMLQRGLNATVIADDFVFRLT